MIPIVFKGGEKDAYTIVAAFPTGLFDILELHYKQAGIIHDLKNIPFNTFMVNTTEKTRRFILQFVAGDFPSTHQAIPVSKYVYSQQIQIYLRLAEGIFALELYVLAGREIKHELINGGIFTNILNHSKNLYIAHIPGDQGSLSSKILLLYSQGYNTSVIQMHIIYTFQFYRI